MKKLLDVKLPFVQGKQLTVKEYCTVILATAAGIVLIILGLFLLLSLKCSCNEKTGLNVDVKPGVTVDIDIKKQFKK